MEDNFGCLYLICFVVTIVICALIFRAVWNSDLPMWLKWMLLR